MSVPKNNANPMLSTEELKRVAKLSCLELNTQEEAVFLSDLGEILAYIKEVDNIAIQDSFFVSKNINVFRDDKNKPSESEDILANSAYVQDRFFVVPKILKN